MPSPPRQYTPTADIGLAAGHTGPSRRQTRMVAARPIAEGELVLITNFENTGYKLVAWEGDLSSSLLLTYIVYLIVCPFEHFHFKRFSF